MSKAFGVWLKRYRGQSDRVHTLRKAFMARIQERNWRASDFQTADSVYVDLHFNDCLPDWAHDVFCLCRDLHAQGRDDFTAREQLAIKLFELEDPVG